jgi:spoIIIJ-associated protein
MHEDDAGDERMDDVEAEELRASPDEVQALADRILKGLALDVAVAASDTEESIEVDITGPDRDYLLDRRGEPLNALQYLLNRIVYRGRRGRRIHVDSEGYRRLREDEIVEIALRTAEKVKARNEECVLNPLNPYERRLVHMALGDVPGVATRSIGDGFLKRIAIYPDQDPGPDEVPHQS